MKHLLPLILLGSLGLLQTGCTESEAQQASQTSEAVTAAVPDYIQANIIAAEQLLSTFDDKSDIQLSFTDEDRTAWNNLPVNEYPRRGVALKNMTDAQRKAVQALLRAGLSDVGYLKINWLFWNDERRREDRRRADNPTWKYYGHNFFWVTVFGEPSATEPWGWQLEGHHLSVNLTFKDGKVAMTPLFLGVDPAVVPDGPFAGLQVMKVETNAGWALMESMSEEQRAQAVIAGEPFADILTRTGEEPHTTERVGIPYRELTPEQRRLLMEIVEEYAGTFAKAPAAAYLDKVQEAENELYFAWAGPTTPGEAVYYRIQGPDFLIEFDNRSGQPNHIHSVWYDLENVFGKAL
jgi:hypothetical protein